MVVIGQAEHDQVDVLAIVERPVVVEVVGNRPLGGEALGMPRRGRGDGHDRDAGDPARASAWIAEMNPDPTSPTRTVSMIDLRRLPAPATSDPRSAQPGTMPRRGYQPARLGR